MSIPDNILDIKAFVQQLLNKISELELRISDLEAENAVLKEENTKLNIENAELKVRLSLNSHNSSKPPSSDGLQKKAAFPRGKNSKQGGQENHKGNTLEMVKDPDHIVICQPEKCNCGQELLEQPKSIITHRQVFDLPEPRLEITEYKIAQVTCPKCGQIHKGEFPSNVNAQTQYGTRVKTLVTLLNTEYKLPFGKIHTLFDDLYGYPINEATIISFNERIYDNLEEPEIQIQENILNSPTANVDESGIRCNGKLHWLHVASTPLFTYLFIHQKRGKEAIESETSILNRFFGWLVHDCWSSYFNLTHLKHAVCGAHLLRELEALIENQSQWAIHFKALLLEVFYTSFDERLDKRKNIEQKYDILLQQAQKEEPEPIKINSRGKYKRTKGRNLLERLQKLKPAVLAFAFNKEVPFTNNQAERDIRPIKVKQKVSGCFRTFKGAQHYARIAGYISTTRKQNLNVFNEICNVYNGISFLNSNHAK